MGDEGEDSFYKAKVYKLVYLHNVQWNLVSVSWLVWISIQEWWPSRYGKDHLKWLNTEKTKIQQIKMYFEKYITESPT